MCRMARKSLTNLSKAQERERVRVRERERKEKKRKKKTTIDILLIPCLKYIYLKIQLLVCAFQPRSIKRTI